jgi:uncharacterized protein (UPF0248 family)
MGRKGALADTISKARYSDDIGLYTVVYRDGRQLREVSLEEFINTKDQYGEPVEIPIHRMREIKRAGTIIWKKIS